MGYPTYNEKNEGNLGWSYLTWELPSKDIIELKISGRMEVTGIRGKRSKQLPNDLKNRDDAVK
jgi:hypothetical protein